MLGAGRPPNSALTTALASIMVAAWIAILLGAGGWAIPDFCASATLAGDRAAALLDLTLLLNPPASRALGWALMLAALMPPLLLVPLRTIQTRALTHRRTRAMVLFTVGYVAVWMGAGMLEQGAALAQVAWPGSRLPLATGLIVALAWQISPAKQYCLNRCHRQPILATFGAAADWDVLRYGLTHGLWCVGTCWAVMALPLLVARGHIFAMAITGLFLLCERLEAPAPLGWRWRGTGKAWRILVGRTRAHLAVRAR